MGQYITALLTTSLLMSVVIFALILFNKLFSDKYPAKWRYYIWLIIIIGLLVPFRPNLGLPTQIPVDSITQSNTNDMALYSTDELVQSGQNGVDYKSVLAETQTIEEIQPQKTMWSLTSTLFVVWLVGVLFTLAFHMCRHKRFIGAAKHWCVDVKDEHFLSVLQKVKSDLGLNKKQVKLKTCKSITSPMLTGFIKPTILLPEKSIHEDDLPMILKHELIHYKRMDLWVKALLMLTNAVHWFNPVVYWMANVIQADCEDSCDEALLWNADIENRRVYGEAIIGVIGIKNAKQTTLSTYFYGGKNTMENRLISIMNTGRKRIGIAILCGALVLMATIMTGALTTDNTSAAVPAEVTVEQAKEIALTKTGGGTITEFKLDYDENDRKVYEIEIINENTKYEMDVALSDGKIYDYKEDIIKNTDIQGRTSPNSTDTQSSTPSNIPNDSSIDAQSNSTTETQNISLEITAEKAKEISLSRTGGGIISECELDYEDGVKVYEIKIINGNIEYEIDVRVSDGNIVKFEKDIDDDHDYDDDDHDYDDDDHDYDDD